MQNIDVCILDLKPSKLFINIGTNDLSNPDITIAEMIANYDKIISRVKTSVPNVSIYLMAYYPINYDAATDDMKPCLLVRTNKRIDEVNEAGYRAIFPEFMKYVVL